MSGSRVKRTAAMIEAAMTMVEAKRSCARPSCSSLAIALLISPITAPPHDAARLRTCETGFHGISLSAGIGALTHKEDLLNVHSRYNLHAHGAAKTALYIEGSDNFVTSIAASIATGWNEPVPGWDLSHWKAPSFTAHNC